MVNCGTVADCSVLPSSFEFSETSLVQLLGDHNDSRGRKPRQGHRKPRQSGLTCHAGLFNISACVFVGHRFG